jgi:hypothetical protein
MAGSFRTGFGVAIGLVIGLIVAGVFIFVGCPMMVCGGLAAVGVAGSEAERAQREKSQSTQPMREPDHRDQSAIDSHSPVGDGAATSTKKNVKAEPAPLGAAAKKRFIASAKAAVEYLSSATPEERDARLNQLRGVKVRWLGTVARKPSKQGNGYDLVARCDGVRVLCVFADKPADRILALKKGTRIAVYGRAIDLADVPKHGPTISLQTDTIRPLKSKPATAQAD